MSHPHNYTIFGETGVKGPRSKYPPPPWFPVCLSPRPLQDYSGLFLAPLAEAEELVSGAASLGEELVAAGLQLPVALG